MVSDSQDLICPMLRIASVDAVLSKHKKQPETFFFKLSHIIMKAGSNLNLVKQICIYVFKFIIAYFISTSIFHLCLVPSDM
jgi:hypothetical protein